MYSSTYQTFHHVPYLFNKVHPQTIQYLPGVHLLLACAAMQLVQYSIPPSYSLQPCNFDLDCNIVITTVTMTVTLQLL